LSRCKTVTTRKKIEEKSTRTVRIGDLDIETIATRSDRVALLVVRYDSEMCWLFRSSTFKTWPVRVTLRCVHSCARVSSSSFVRSPSTIPSLSTLTEKGLFWMGFERTLTLMTVLPWALGVYLTWYVPSPLSVTSALIGGLFSGVYKHIRLLSPKKRRRDTTLIWTSTVDSPPTLMSLPPAVRNWTVNSASYPTSAFSSPGPKAIHFKGSGTT
jgi:hypothetical protein